MRATPTEPEAPPKPCRCGPDEYQVELVEVGDPVAVEDDLPVRVVAQVAEEEQESSAVDGDVE